MFFVNVTMLTFFLEKGNFIDFKKLHQGDTMTWNLLGLQTAHSLKKSKTQKGQQKSLVQLMSIIFELLGVIVSKWYFSCLFEA